MSIHNMSFNDWPSSVPLRKKEKKKKGEEGGEEREGEEGEGGGRRGGGVKPAEKKVPLFFVDEDEVPHFGDISVIQKIRNKKKKQEKDREGEREREIVFCTF